jgi:SpoVK/Ycf46/Vps4 family AAA+-type ATPase
MAASNQLFEIYQLPKQQDMFLQDWDVVLMPEQTKRLLLNYAQTLGRLAKVRSSGLALRRALLLYGPPGCGKTSLARGLPARCVADFRVPRAGFIHVNTHALFSGIRGEGQKNVLATFEQIAEQASSGVPIFVLVDEVETLGTDRASISPEANPLDALFQVTAFFESLDRCARELPNVVFLFTTNIPKAIDRAVRERVDFAIEIPLPDAVYRSMILVDAIRSIAAAYEVRELLHKAACDPPDADWAALIANTNGLSGRALRHVLVMAATLAVNSRELLLGDLVDASIRIKSTEDDLWRSGGMYLERYQGSPSIPPDTPATGKLASAQTATASTGLNEEMLGAITAIRAEVTRVRAGMNVARADIQQMREALGELSAKPRRSRKKIGFGRHRADNGGSAGSEPGQERTGG